MNRFLSRPGAVRRGHMLAVALLSLFPLACGSSGLTSVSGKVTYQGKPVPLGTITFVPNTPGARNATGMIGSDGSYTLQTETPGDGAAPGEYKVTISARDDVVLDYIPATPPKPKILVPEKYEKLETTDLKATVKSGGNTIPFDIP